MSFLEFRDLVWTDHRGYASFVAMRLCGRKVTNGQGLRKTSDSSGVHLTLRDLIINIDHHRLATRQCPFHFAVSSPLP